MTVIIDARAILQPWQIDMTQGLRKARGSGAARSGLGRLAARAMLGPLLLCPCTVQSQPLHADRPSPAFTDGMAVLNRPTDGDFTPSAKLPPRPAWTPDPKRDPIVLPPATPLGSPGNDTQIRTAPPPHTAIFNTRVPPRPTARREPAKTVSEAIVKVPDTPLIRPSS